MTHYPAYDAGQLRLGTYGSQAPLWWGVVALSGAVSVVYGGLIFAYFYLRMGQPAWPPGAPNGPFGPPELVLPTIGSFLLWVSALTWWGTSRSAARGASRTAAIWLTVTVLLACAFDALKVHEMFALPFGWDMNPYGSIFWVFNGFQFLNVAAMILWAIPLLALAWSGGVGERRRLGLEINRLYWNVTLVWWVFGYLVLYYAPRVFYYVPRAPGP